jgi:pimeloyl-ACP methyl ester carboxylesterase
MTITAKAETKTVDIGHSEIAYRVFGEGQPIIFLNRFRAAMDDWDPALVEQLVRGNRQVIVFDNVGVGASTGAVPNNLEQAADDAVRFADAIGLRQVDVLGWSMGGMTAQLLALRHPDLVRKLVLAGTLPPVGTPEVIPASQQWGQVATKPTYSDEDILFLFFTKSEASRAAGLASLARMSHPGRPGSSVKTKPEIMPAQIQAITGFARNEGGWYGRLKEIMHPTLVANGDRDAAFPAIDSVVLAREIPNSHLIIYPDAGHGFLFQMPDRFGDDVDAFLNS